MISLVIPTLNSERTLGACLCAITAQRLPRDQYEIVVADAGSTDRTLAVASAFGVDTVVHNPLKTGEAGRITGLVLAALAAQMMLAGIANFFGLGGAAGAQITEQRR